MTDEQALKKELLREALGSAFLELLSQAKATLGQKRPYPHDVTVGEAIDYLYQKAEDAGAARS